MAVLALVVFLTACAAGLARNSLSENHHGDWRPARKFTVTRWPCSSLTPPCAIKGGQDRRSAMRRRVAEGLCPKDRGSSRSRCGQVVPVAFATAERDLAGPQSATCGSPGLNCWLRCGRLSLPCRLQEPYPSRWDRIPSGWGGPLVGLGLILLWLLRQCRQVALARHKSIRGILREAPNNFLSLIRPLEAG